MLELVRQIVLIVAAAGAAMPAYASPRCGCDERRREHQAAGGALCEGAGCCGESTGCCGDEPSGGSVFELVGCCESGACECEGCDGPRSSAPVVVQEASGELSPVQVSVYAPAGAPLELAPRGPPMGALLSLGPAARPSPGRLQAELCVWLI